MEENKIMNVVNEEVAVEACDLVSTSGNNHNLFKVIAGTAVGAVVVGGVVWIGKKVYKKFKNKKNSDTEAEFVDEIPNEVIEDNK